MEAVETPTKKPASRAMFALRVATLIAMVLGVNYAGNHLDIVRGDSVPISLAWITGGKVALGDYVVFDAQNPIINEGRKAKLTKQVVCVAGETIGFDGNVWRCDGRVLGGVIRQTFDGKPIKIADVSGTIPAGKVFVMGPHPRSFDSRYLGLIEVARVTRVEPIL